MRTDNKALTDVAVSVADGQPVDWEAAEVQLSQPERRLVRQLRLVESISTLYRTLSSEPRPDARPDPIRHWGGLVLLDRIGEGTTGEVYRAFDSHLHRDVAVKLLHPDRHSFDSHSRLIEEARRLARLRHENVVSVYGAESHEGRAGLWMELVRGESLEAGVKAHGPFQPADAARAGAQICRALSAVHAAGLLHRDVKAQNVVQEPSGRLVLMDFGTGEELRRMQGSNRMVGTPLYLAPEIFKGHAATVQSDIYSLGVLLFYLLTGRFPVMAGSMADLGRAHREGRRERLSALAAGVPQSLRAIVDRALDPEPGRRFRTADELARALDAVLGGAVGHHATPVAAGRRWVFPLAAAALLAVTVALIAWTIRTPAAPAQTTKRIAVNQMTAIDPAVTPPFLTEGMTDQLVSTLGRIRSLEVLAPRQAEPSAQAYRTAAAADVILQTSLLISPGEEGAPPLARVNARLVNAGTGAVLWADTFMRPMGDTFSLQADIARRIAASVNATVTPEEARRLGTHRPTSPEADAAFLEGRAYIDKYGTEAWRRALDAFERAVQADASHAGAHAGMARALYSLGRANAIPQAQARARAHVAAQQALQLDEALPEAHATLGDLAFFYDWDWRTAESHYLRSLALNPSFTYGYQQYADMLAASGRTGEAVVQAEATLNLVPTDARAHRQLALMRFYHRDFDGASAALARSRDFDLHAAGAWIISGRIAEAAGRLDEAREHIDRGAALSEGVPALLRVQQIRLMALTGDPAGARAALEALRREFAESPRPWDPQFDAYVLLALGEHERAMTALESAVQQRHPSALWVAVDPRLDPIRNHPRFAAILREIGVH